MIGPTSNLDSEQARLDGEQTRLNLRQAELAAERHRRLEAAHAETVAAARRAKDELGRFEREKAEAQRGFILAQSLAENARNSRHWHEEAKPQAYSYPTADEVQRWQEKAVELQAAVDEAQRRCTEAWNLYQSLRVQWLAARETFQAAADAEAAARAVLNPQPRNPITLTIRDGHTPVSLVRTA